MNLTARRMFQNVQNYSVALVGLGLYAIAVVYTVALGGAFPALALELLLPLGIGTALLWYGWRLRTRRSREWKRVVTASALACGVAVTALSGWISTLVWLRTGGFAVTVQPMVSAIAVGVGFGALLGHIYVGFAYHHRENEQFSQAIEASMDGIAIVEDSRYTYVNDAYALLYDVGEKRALEGHTWKDMFTNASRTRIENDVVPTLTERNYWRGTLTGKRTDGSTFPQEMTVSSLEDGHVIIARDISDQRSREQRIQVLSRVLRHNLRNAFTVIRGHANIIGQQDSDLQAAHVDPIIEEIDDLLATADKARGVERTLERHGEMDVIEATEAIRSAVDRATAAYPQARIVSQIETFGADTPTIDATVIDALNELVDNAVEHHPATDEPPTVELGVQTRQYESETRLELTVADDGDTIPEDERRAVLKGEETQLDHGSGLGLWLVNWITRSAGGDLRFAEQPTGGTVVTLSFPHERPETDPGAAVQSEAPKQNTNR